MNQFKETSNIHFKRKAKLKKQISDLTTEMMKVGISKVKIEIPDWQTIDNSSLKYQFLLKLTNMVCNIIGEFVQESNEQIIKLYRSFVQEINTNIHLSKNFIKKDNYNTAFKKLYRTLEINLTTYKLIKEIEKNPNIDVEQYFKNLKVNSDKDDNQSNIEVEKGKNL